VANAHTVYEKQEGKIMFSSTDDEFGVDICQVCHKPPFVASLWHKIFGSPTSLVVATRPKIYPEVAVTAL
jgi:hypothetical protein